MYKAHFNIVERGSDDDASGVNLEVVDAETLKDLETLIQDTKANKKVFCEYFQIKTVADLKKADVSRAFEMLQHKKSSAKK